MDKKNLRRLFVLCSVIAVMFFVLVQRLYKLQIVEGSEYLTDISRTIQFQRDIPAARGNIYDRFGRPLAVNTPSYNVKFNPSSYVEDLNSLVSNLLDVLERYDENFVDELPITRSQPFEFVFQSENQEVRWKKDMGLEGEQLDFNAVDTIKYLRKFFKIPDEKSDGEARDIVSMRSSIFMQRYRQYNPITLALNIKPETLIILEENKERFPGVFVEADYFRYYPEKEFFSHILGYIRPINEDELKEYKPHGYTSLDLIGKLGIEKSYELALSGKKGKKIVEIAPNGKIIGSSVTVAPSTGDNVYLTLDRDLQKKVTSILIENLKKVLIKKSDNRDIKQKLISGEMSPSDTNLDPCTGSVAVVDVNTGEVLALVSYPSYDNNMLVNNFNVEYYNKLLNDPTTPMINRPLMERKAPGSTLKMLSAIAGLESGIITPYTKIQDKGIYENAGKPFAKCLIYSRYGSTHGAIDVSKAIEVSCNYFFYEMAYRMGNAPSGTTLNSIATFNEYMVEFGLNDFSGVEIEEYRPKMASAENKRALELALNKNATESQLSWKDGDSIRNAIGQSINNYSVIHIAKYIATLANGGLRYKLSLIKGTKGIQDSSINYNSPFLEKELDLNPANLKAVYDGMLGVTSGSQGTLRSIFANFPIKVAGKTGTAEESNKRPSHTWFTGYAPFDNPQIAVVVMIPFGESTENPAPKIAREIFAEYFGIYAEPQKPTEVNVLIR